MANVIEYTIKGVDKFSGAMSGVEGALGRLASASNLMRVGIAAAATAAIGLTLKLNEQIDAAGKAAAVMGVSTQAYTRLAYAAKLADMDSTAFAGTMKHLSTSTAQAAQGIGRSQKAFDALGIDAAKFTNLHMQDQLIQLADAFKAVENPQQKMLAATQLFGGSAQQMLEMLDGGAEGLKAAALEAEKFGVVMSNSAAASADELGDANTRLGEAMKGAGNVIATTLAPALTVVINALANGVGYVTRFAQRFVNAMEFMAVSVIAVGDGIVQIFGEAFDGVGNIISAFGTWAKENIKAIFTGGEFVSFGDTVGKAWNDTMDNMGAVATKTKDVIKMAWDDLVFPEVDIEPIRAAAEEIVNVADAATSGLDMTKDKVSELNQEVEDFGSGIQMQSEGVGDYVWAMAEQTNLWLSDMSDNAHQFASDFFSVMDGAIQSVSDGIANVIVEGGSMRDMFNNVAKQVLQNLISMLIKLGIQRLILAGVTKGAIATESMAQMSAETGRTFAAAFASTAAIPIYGPALAPGVAAAATSAMLAGAVGAAAAGSTVGATIGAAHGGLTNVPNEATYLLQSGERVLSPNQNADLVDFMAGGASGGSGVHVENITLHILENATNADALLNMSKTDIDRVVAGPILDSLNRLSRRGIRPEAQERLRS